MRSCTRLFVSLAVLLGAGCSKEQGVQAAPLQAGASAADGGGAGAAGELASSAGSGVSGTGAGASPISSGGASAAAGASSAAGAAAGSGGAVAAAGSGPSAAGAAGELGGAGSGAAGSAGAAAAAGSGAPADPVPDPKYLVSATGPCPEFREGYVNFNPDGMQRRVLLYISDAAMTKDGPLIFSWHSTLPNPEDATAWLGRSVIEEIKQLGGIVAAPTTGYPRETRPWDNTPMGARNTDGDQRLMDEIVACAQSKVGIDLRRIHATGMSAGGLKTSTVSLRRSGYLASVVVYSGGLTQGDLPPDQEPNNKLAAMILYGGVTDISPVDGILYTDASRRYLELLRSQGRFAFLCNHGGGHSVPNDSQASAWRFMQDHPFGVTPSPYAAKLPDGFLRYCSLD